MTVRKAHTARVSLALTVLLSAGVLSAPVRAADTKDQLEAAKDKVAALQAEAQAATVAYEQAHEKLVTTQREIAEVQEALGGARTRVGTLQERLNDRARAVYQMGPTNTVDLLLESQSFAELSTRLAFIDRLAEDDADLVTRVDVLSEELRRQEAELERLEAEHAAAEREADRQKDIIYGNLAEAEALEARLGKKYRAELAAARAAATAAAVPTSGGSGSIPAVRGGALQACPAPGSTFTDTFGAPRSGGRSHQGVDMMGNYGMPIYAAQSGSLTKSSSSLGGIQAYVYAGNGDFTFYAHLQGYSNASGNVSAGTLIGYMGDTGNASGNPHLHFEYHPGGGAAVNPTPYVAAVC